MLIDAGNGTNLHVKVYARRQEAQLAEPQTHGFMLRTRRGWLIRTLMVMTTYD